MSPEQAREFIKKYPQAKSFVKASHLEGLSPLLEVHIEAIEVTKAEFHELEGGKTYMPRKETTDKFGQAAGVSFNQAAESTRMEGDGVFVGRSQAMVMGPDGKMILGSACEYEFNVDVRLAELELNGKADWSNKDQYGKPGRAQYTATELKKERIQLMKVGRQRANTGARSRATVSILGMQTGFKGLFQKNEPDTAARTFLFSRIIVNAKNELVMKRMLDSIGGNAMALFGPTPVAQLSSSHGHPAGEDSGFRDVTGSASSAASASGGASDWDDDFGDAPAAAPAENARLGELTGAIAEWAECGDSRIASRARRILDRGEQSIEILELSLKILKYLGSGSTRGAKTCADALDLPAPDLIVLRDVVAKLPAQTQGVA